MFFCELCKQWESEKNHSHHHVWKEAVFGDGRKIDVCRTPCHDALEELIRIKENDLLRHHPEIYEEALAQLKGNNRAIRKYYGFIKKRKRRR
jgi:hypothetical protein